MRRPRGNDPSPLAPVDVHNSVERPTDLSDCDDPPLAVIVPAILPSETGPLEDQGRLFGAEPTQPPITLALLEIPLEQQEYTLLA